MIIIIVRCFYRVFKMCPEIKDFTYFYAEHSEKAMAPHSSTLAWKIPWSEEPGWLRSMGSWRVGYDWATSLSLFTFMHWRRKWQPTPMFLPGESPGQRSLVGCRLWGRTELDTTEATKQQQQQHAEHSATFIKMGRKLLPGQFQNVFLLQFWGVSLKSKIYTW